LSVLIIATTIWFAQTIKSLIYWTSRQNTLDEREKRVSTSRDRYSRLAQPRALLSGYDFSARLSPLAKARVFEEISLERSWVNLFLTSLTR
jgi:hypothetical protein